MSKKARTILAVLGSISLVQACGGDVGDEAEPLARTDENALAQTVCCSAGEGSSCTATCPAGMTVQSVVSAKYGAPACSNLPSCGAASGATCTKAPSCVGQSSCSYTFNNVNCGDSCYGYDKTGTLTVQCVSNAASSYVTAVMADAPKAYWRLGEANGSIASDSSGNGRSGTYVGAPSLGGAGALAGDSNTSATFNGSSQLVEVANHAALNPTQFSVEAWVYLTGGAGTFRSVVTSRETSPVPRGYTLYANSSNQWAFWTGTGAGWQQLNGPAVSVNQWTHVVATYDGTTARLYINGAQAASGAMTYAPNAARPLRIAAGKTETLPTYYLPGRVDEVSVYDKALSAAAVQAHYSAAGSVSAAPACSDGIDNDGDGKVDYPADLGCTSATDTDELNPAGNALRWKPPGYDGSGDPRDPSNYPGYIVVDAPQNGGSLTLDDTKDYFIKLGHPTWSSKPQGGGNSSLGIAGGKNRVIVGGEITAIPTNKYDDIRSLVIDDGNPAGITHVEGVAIVSVNGPTLRTKQIVQLQNMRVKVYNYQDDASAGVHPDIIQIWDRGPIAELRVDRFTGFSDYTGLSVLLTPNPVKWTRQNMDIHALPPQPSSVAGNMPSIMGPLMYFGDQKVTEYIGQNLWVETGYYDASYRRKLDDVSGWGQTAPPYELHGTDNLYYASPDSGPVPYGVSSVRGSADNFGRRQGDTITWSRVPLLVKESWTWGTPPTGQFVPAGLAGVNYVSPGYQ